MTLRRMKQPQHMYIDIWLGEMPRASSGDLRVFTYAPGVFGGIGGRAIMVSYELQVQNDLGAILFISFRSKTPKRP